MERIVGFDSGKVPRVFRGDDDILSELDRQASRDELWANVKYVQGMRMVTLIEKHIYKTVKDILTNTEYSIPTLDLYKPIPMTREEIREITREWSVGFQECVRLALPHMSNKMRRLFFEREVEVDEAEIARRVEETFF